MANLTTRTVTPVAPSPACSPSYEEVPAIELASNGELLTNLCAQDGGAADAGSAMVSSLFPTGATSPTISLQGTAGGELDPTATWLWVHLPGGGGELVRTSDGSVVGTYPDASFSTSFDASGQHAYYTTALASTTAVGGSLVQLTLSANPTSTVLVASGAYLLLGIDPTGQFLLYMNNDSTPSVYLRATTPAAESTRVFEFGEVANWSFTADGSYLLLQGESGGDPTGVVTSIATANPSSVVTLGTSWFLPLRAAEVLGRSASGAGLVLDGSGSAPPWTFTPSLGGALATANGASIVYTTGASPPGLYVVATP